ncbi:MAG: hypothetical protein IJ007_06320 [Oscillospiraceae bacterium]|nr:hypothetical protein [Oscillospiraceae bacterium]
MDERRCIFCGGRLLDNVCVNCGFECLSEEQIAAPYDFEPSNDSYGEEEVSGTEVMEGISADNISMESLDGSMPSVAVKPAPVRNNTAYAPPPVQKVQNNQPAYTPPPAPIQQNASVFETIVKDFSTYIQKNWWQFLLVLLVPTTSFFIGAFYFSKLKRGGTVIDVIIGILFIIIGASLKFSGFDLFGIDAVLSSILEAMPRRRHRYRY